MKKNHWKKTNCRFNCEHSIKSWIYVLFRNSSIFASSSSSHCLAQHGLLSPFVIKQLTLKFLISAFSSVGDIFFLINKNVDRSYFLLLIIPFLVFNLLMKMNVVARLNFFWHFDFLKLDPSCPFQCLARPWLVPCLFLYRNKTIMKKEFKKLSLWRLQVMLFSLKFALNRNQFINQKQWVAKIL